jgi:hypothetical protein
VGPTDFKSPVSYSGRNLKFTIIPPLPAVDAPGFTPTFSAKLQQCSVRCQFQYEDADRSAKQIKTSDLSDVLRIFDVTHAAFRLQSGHLVALLDMIAANIRRAVPRVDSRCWLTGQVHPFVDPEWAHLSIVYQILKRTLLVFPRAPEVDFRVMRTVLGQVGSPDKREHREICAVVQSYLESHQPDVPRVWPALESALLIWSDTPNFAFAASCTLAITDHLFHMGHSSTAFFHRTVIPLATSSHFNFFRRAWTPLVTNFVSGDPRAANSVLSSCLRYWPHCGISKQVAFLKIIVVMLHSVPARQLADWLPRGIAIVSDCIVGSSHKAAERAMEFVLDGRLDFVLRTKDTQSFTRIHQAALSSSQCHWNWDVKDLAKNVLTHLSRIDFALSRDLGKPGNDSRLLGPDDPVVRGWAHIAQTAARRDVGVSLGKKLSEILKTFGGANRAPGLQDIAQMRRGSLVPAVERLPALQPIRASWAY